MIKHVWFHRICSYVYHKLPYSCPEKIEEWFLNHSMMIAICSECIEFFDKYVDTNPVYTSDIKSGWKEIFFHVCYEMGINRKSADVLFEDLVFGNWKHLHHTDEEKQFTKSDWFQNFMWELHYCADIWSLDRLTRCHWLFRQWIECD